MNCHAKPTFTVQIEFNALPKNSNERSCNCCEDVLLTGKIIRIARPFQSAWDYLFQSNTSPGSKVYTQAFHVSILIIQAILIGVILLYQNGQLKKLTIEAFKTSIKWLVLATFSKDLLLPKVEFFSNKVSRRYVLDLVCHVELESC